MTVIEAPTTTRAARAAGHAAPSVGVSEHIAEIAGSLNLTNARLVAVMAEVLESGSWAGPGIRSARQWLAWKAGVSLQRAQDIVKVARRRSEFPVLIAEFDAGQLSLEQMVVLVDAPAWADEDLLCWGRVATVARLRKTIREQFFTGDPDAPDDPDREPADRDRISTGATDEHRWRISGELDLGRGQRVDAALIEARERLWECGQTSISNADCLVEICEHYLAGTGSETRRERSKTWIHLDADTGAADTGGCRLPESVRDRLVCDGDVQPVWEREGMPFSVGRTQRIVPERTRRLIERRDHGCRVPGCTNGRFVEIHHVVHWLRGGPTDTDNLVSLCPHHHRLHHQGLLGISGNADDRDGIVFTDQLGAVIEPVGRPQPPPAPPAGPDECYRPPLMEPVDYTLLGWIHPNELARRRAAALRRAEECQRARARPPD